jgi:hypothetical protein
VDLLRGTQNYTEGCGSVRAKDITLDESQHYRSRLNFGVAMMQVWKYRRPFLFLVVINSFHCRVRKSVFAYKYYCRLVSAYSHTVNVFAFGLYDFDGYVKSNFHQIYWTDSYYIESKRSFNIDLKSLNLFRVLNI